MAEQNFTQDFSPDRPEPEPKPAEKTRGLIGTTFCGYEIEGELGRGGMGVVYRARQAKLNRTVALKMLTGHFGPDELKRFLAESQTAAGLHHTNIVHIYEIGENEGVPFFSMEFVEGGSLADRLRKKGPPPVREAAALMMTVARALHFAHQNSVVHRDMKPGNVLVDSDGVPKVADFGIAKRLSDDSALTLSGAVIGTPAYMAPEQAKGTSRHVGPAADVYALGAMLYEMLTGRPPFLPEDSETAITIRVMSEDPVSPAYHCPQIPRDLETICMKCIEKEPRDRYNSAAALAEDLRRFLDDEPILARPPTKLVTTMRWVRRHPWKFTLWSVLLLLAGAGGQKWWHWEMYERLRFEYATALDWIDGHPEPAVRLTADEAARREVSLRLTRHGRRGMVTRVEALNPRGHPAAVLTFFGYDVLPNWIDGIAGMQSFEDRRRETTELALTYRDRELVENSGLDCNGRPIWRASFDRTKTGVRARFVGGRGFEFAGREAAASLVELERDAAGREVRARFFNNSGEAAKNGEGTYGYEFTRDERGRVVRLMNLGRDDRPAPNRIGVHGLAFTWNAQGRVSRNAYLDAAGSPAAVGGVASTEMTHDAAGNVMQMRFMDDKGQIANTGAFSQIDFTRNERGQTTEQVYRRRASDGQLTVTGRRLIAYDDFGYAAEVQVTGGGELHARLRSDPVGNVIEERWLDAAGQPLLGPKGWAIRRATHSAIASPPGWREEETYFDTKDAKTFCTSGHHRLISDFDPNGNLRRTVFEDNDPARFKYYRYVAETEYDTRARLRRAVVRYENEKGDLATHAGRLFTSIETEYDENEREITEWKLGCDVAELGAPAWKTETQWHSTGMRKQRIRQACDEKRQPLDTISNGNAARSEENFNELQRIERLHETGFDEKLSGFSIREAIFNSGEFQSVTHRRKDGTKLETIRVLIKGVFPDAQEKSRELLRAGDQFLGANGEPVKTAYEWVFTNQFAGGYLEVLRDGKGLKLEGFAAGQLGIALEERSMDVP
jgi:tRNA A-37 threonylcarbamoyl transferase component Bud32